MFYIDSTSELGTAGALSVPLDVWIEVEFFTEPERTQCAYTGQYEFNGFLCDAGETCTGWEAPNGRCIQVAACREGCPRCAALTMVYHR